MPVISDAQIAGYAKATGLNNSQTAIAVAIALAESGGNTQSHNGVPPDDSYGLWQINMLGSMGPSRRQQFGIASNSELFEPAINARAMHYLSNGGQNWRAWTTYTRGTYLRFISRGQAVAGTAGATGGATTTSVGLSDSLSSIQDTLTLLSNPKFWLRAGIVLGGVLIAFYGIMKVTGDNQLGQGTKSVAKAAIGLIPGGGTVTQVVKSASRVVK
jgi:hypothetical protein